MQRAEAILVTLNVPEEKRDLNKRSNMWWLLKNVHKYNNDHPDCNEFINLIKEELIDED